MRSARVPSGHPRAPYFSLPPLTLLENPPRGIRDDSAHSKIPKTACFARRIDGPHVHGDSELTGTANDEADWHRQPVVLVGRANRAVWDASGLESRRGSRHELENVAPRGATGERRLEKRVQGASLEGGDD